MRKPYCFITVGHIPAAKNTFLDIVVVLNISSRILEGTFYAMHKAEVLPDSSITFIIKGCLECKYVEFL